MAGLVVWRRRHVARPVRPVVGRVFRPAVCARILSARGGTGAGRGRAVVGAWGGGASPPRRMRADPFGAGGDGGVSPGLKTGPTAQGVVGRAWSSGGAGMSRGGLARLWGGSSDPPYARGSFHC